MGLAEACQRPHPLLTEPTLYAVDIPDRVKWAHLKACLSPCGDVRSGKRSTTETGRKRWTIHFETLLDAEMALATLQGAPVAASPAWALALSHAPGLARAAPAPADAPCAQFVQGGEAGGIHALHLASAQQVFRWFRVAGPLVVVRTGVDVGYPQRTCVLEYWDVKGADYARRWRGELHSMLRGMEPFSLRTFAPHCVLASNLGPSFKASDVQKTFGQFGSILHSHIVKVGSTDCHCTISFSTREAAAAAISALNETEVAGTTRHVRYFEPGKQSDFLLEIQRDIRRLPVHHEEPPSSPTGKPDKAEAAPQADDAPNDSSTTEAEARREATAAARAEYERKLHAATAARELAHAAESAARAHAQSLTARYRSTHAAHAAATRERTGATAALSAASAEVRTAEQALAAAKARQKAVLARVERASAAESDADRALRAVGTEKMHAESMLAEAELARKEAERRETELREKEPPVDEAARREEELKEMIRRMKALREVEARERREKQEREEAARHQAEAARLAQEECERKQREEREEADRLAKEERERKQREEREEAARRREEAARLAREARERTEREEREREARQAQEYHEAAAREHERCVQRDHKWCLRGVRWTDARYVSWFKLVSAEFDDAKFAAARPLTLRSVPWPLLTPPDEHTFDLLEWGNVEAFFAAAKRAVGEAEYRTIVEKAHRRFHPDKWRSRGLLNTVLDVELRERVEKAGNIVAQAITPLWLASRSKQ
ncbi:RNA-binding protein [Phanerochaete sordida]|uniref:RNA-binding protein n=1 Tax=Phanerochaete sordida TaxID=48140 RepID=A0A9P3GE11_9APHY|nr:RNA-binding protein [Phanerochaete sordida]